MLTPRQETHLRLLSQSEIDREDYDEAQYLIGLGYATAKSRISRRKDSYGQILDLSLWRPTAEGLQYAAQLEQAAQDVKQPEHHNLHGKVEDNGLPHTPQPEKAPAKLWHERSTLNYVAVAIIATVLGGVAVAVILRLLSL